MPDRPSNLITVGRVTGVFGIKGWVKVKSFTDPVENITGYDPWWLKTKHGVKPYEVEEFNYRPQGLVVRFKGISDRDIAAESIHTDIAVERGQLPTLTEGEYYWHQLIGLNVVSEVEGIITDFGKVKSMLETGANDVMVVAPTDTSCDERERLIPYVMNTYVQSVDLQNGQINVIWDPDF